MSRAYQQRTAEERDAENLKIVELADQECLSKGLTSVGDAGAGWGTVELYKRIIDEGKLGVRINVMLSESAKRIEENAAAWKINGYGADHLSVHTIKRLIDGALGPRGAWLLEPYEDLATSVGLNTESIEDMKETARVAIENGFQVATHAIGDRANRETLEFMKPPLSPIPTKKTSAGASSTPSTSIRRISPDSGSSGSSRRCRPSIARRTVPGSSSGSGPNGPRKGLTCGGRSCKRER